MITKNQLINSFKMYNFIVIEITGQSTLKIYMEDNKEIILPLQTYYSNLYLLFLFKLNKSAFETPTENYKVFYYKMQLQIELNKLINNKNQTT